MSALPWPRRAATRDVVLIGVAVVLLALAVVLFLYLRRPHDAPTDQFVQLHCPTCPHDFRLSYADFDRAFERNEYKILGQRSVVFRCPKCGQMTAERVGTPGTAPTPPPRPAGPGA